MKRVSPAKKSNLTQPSILSRVRGTTTRRDREDDVRILLTHLQSATNHAIHRVSTATAAPDHLDLRPVRRDLHDASRPVQMRGVSRRLAQSSSVRHRGGASEGKSARSHRSSGAHRYRPLRSLPSRSASRAAKSNEMKSRLQQTPLIDGLKLKKVTPARFWIEAEKEILAESKSISYAQTVTERKHLGRRDPTIQPQRSVCAFETIMQNGTPTTTDVDSGRLRVKKTNRPLPRCADEDLGFGTVRARYSQAVGKEGGARPPIAAFENRVDYGDGRAIVEVFA